MNVDFPFDLRPATAADAKAIRNLIHFVNINPMNLDWRHFVIAVDSQGKMLGCGQIKPHGDGTRELASIAVWPEYRHKGIAHAVIGRLLQENQPPLYLTCVESRGTFYEQFGFHILKDADLPPYFRRIRRIVTFIRWFSPRMENLLVMLKDT